MNVRRVVGLAILTIAISTCNGVSPEITLDGRTYFPVGEAAIPAADLTSLGMASGSPGDLVTDLGAFAIAGVDPSAVIALSIDQSQYADLVRKRREEGAPVGDITPTHMLFLNFGAEAIPPAVCRYVDPTSGWAPADCQGVLSVVVEGRTYLAVPPERDKATPVEFAFGESDVAAVGRADEIDPRLLPIDPTVYAVAGVDQALVVLLQREADPRYYVFLEGTQTAVPPALCAYLAPEPDFVVPLPGCRLAPTD